MSCCFGESKQWAQELYDFSSCIFSFSDRNGLLAGVLSPLLALGRHFALVALLLLHLLQINLSFLEKKNFWFHVYILLLIALNLEYDSLPTDVFIYF